MAGALVTGMTTTNQNAAIGEALAAAGYDATRERLNRLHAECDDLPPLEREGFRCFWRKWLSLAAGEIDVFETREHRLEYSVARGWDQQFGPGIARARGLR